VAIQQQVERVHPRDAEHLVREHVLCESHDRDELPQPTRSRASRNAGKKRDADERAATPGGDERALNARRRRGRDGERAARAGKGVAWPAQGAGASRGMRREAIEAMAAGRGADERATRRRVSRPSARRRRIAARRRRGEIARQVETRTEAVGDAPAARSPLHPQALGAARTTRAPIVNSWVTGSERSPLTACCASRIVRPRWRARVGERAISKPWARSRPPGGGPCGRSSGRRLGRGELIARPAGSRRRGSRSACRGGRGSLHVGRGRDLTTSGSIRSRRRPTADG